MRYFESIINKIGHPVMLVSAIFLLGTMALTVANVISRLFGSVIAGTYELTEVLIIVVAATSLGYAALKKSHVIVDIFVSRVPQRVQGIIDAFTSVLGLAVWGIVTWQSINLLLIRWSQEDTELLNVPYYPFRILWIIGLVFLCLILVKDIVAGLRGEANR
jgi:TRAP-type C4-dicarboxylate transport system permease small subunit